MSFPIHLRNLSLLLALVLTPFPADRSRPAPIYTYQRIARYPHSTASYTEGFFYLDGRFYEGTMAACNLLPIPPLDGAVVWGLIPELIRRAQQRRRMQKVRSGEREQ